ncbi:hypothetical protein [Nonlabens marinus]|uniref:Lipoprotein n=1 Tax=Nonlabens marinus S1-08 TaxID=1454201 RepID=W8VZP0_9FLAO|nr:hypothetical protein [Nonlabens marinus]BAO54911.1 hypothetical protein NMS_0902 [Nonlabens marinus S1-08]
MKKILILILILTTSCQQELDPSAANINSIFETQDFQIRFTLENGSEYRMGFLNNEMAFFSPTETVRRELSYDDVRLINTFVQNRYRASEDKIRFQPQVDAVNPAMTERSQNHSRIEIYNDTKKVTLTTPDATASFQELLSKLELPYVSTEKK